MAKEAAKRDPAISGFVREKIRLWKEGGRELQELARIAGLSKSMPSQVLSGTNGVGGRSLPGFAKAFGYADVEELQRAAYDWWISSGETGASLLEMPPTEAMGAAIEYVLGLNQTTKAHLRTILARFTHPDFRQREAEWWIQTLLAEVRRDKETIRVDEQARKKEYAAQAAIRETAALLEKKPATTTARPRRKATA